MNDDRVALEELADRLRDERRIVTLLLYKLTVSRLLLGADERGFAAAALREVDRAMELLHDGVLHRDEAIRKLAELWQDAPDEVSLPSLEPRQHELREATEIRAISDELADIDADVERRQATLRALARALPPSLVSFLR